MFLLTTSSVATLVAVSTVTTINKNQKINKQQLSSTSYNANNLQHTPSVAKSTVVFNLIDKSVVGSQGQRVGVTLFVYNLLKKQKVYLKLINSSGQTQELSTQPFDGNLRVWIPITLPFNKSKEAYTLDAMAEHQKFKASISATILQPEVKSFDKPKLILGKDKIEGISVIPSHIENAPNDGIPNYYWETDNGKTKINAVQKGDEYTLPETEINSVLNKTLHLVAKYKDVNEPITLSTDILVSHKFDIPQKVKHAQNDWWIIPVVFGIVGALALGVGLIWFIKAKVKK